MERPLPPKSPVLEHSHGGQRLPAPNKCPNPRVPAQSPIVHGNPFLSGLATSPSSSHEPWLAIDRNTVKPVFELLELNLRKLATFYKSKPLKALLKKFVAHRSTADPL